VGDAGGERIIVGLVLGDPLDLSGRVGAPGLGLNAGGFDSLQVTDLFAKLQRQAVGIQLFLPDLFSPMLEIGFGLESVKVLVTPPCRSSHSPAFLSANSCFRSVAMEWILPVPALPLRPAACLAACRLERSR